MIHHANNDNIFVKTPLVGLLLTTLVPDNYRCNTGNDVMTVMIIHENDNTKLFTITVRMR